MSRELIALSAREAVRRLKSGEITAVELVEAALARLDEVEPQVNAVPTICAERALAQARIAEPDTLLAGLPVVIKDLHEVGGVRTTYGSPIFQDLVPAQSDRSVARIERNGGVILGKSNTPEFGAGANTFNEVFGATRNPWNTSKSCAGSSGGSAVALATGTAWLADGSDLGGSLRNPAAFTGIVGLRPSPGRVPTDKEGNRFQTLSVRGPMARDVRDCALMLDAMCGFEPRDPLSFDAPVTPFATAVETPPKLTRVAWTKDLGGITPVDPEVALICERAARAFEDLGVEVIEASPDFAAAVDTFTVLRAELFAANMAPLLEQHRDLLKPEVVWNIEKGLGLDAGAIGAAERARGKMHASLLDLFDEVDLLLCPAAICPAFAVEQRYLEELNGHRFATYIDWVAIASAISMTGAPALSLPAGLTEAGLPVGLQIVGRPRGEAALLAAAAMLEDRIGRLIDGPLDPRPPRPSR
ncbi:MAG: amidase [Geminicoccaceae bacterium]|nr:MAG: amidase [Geminicoccaceae bacterium]